jgi:hypothetical protein
MGAKTWMLVYSNGDVPSIWGKEPALKNDRDIEILKYLFPNNKFSEIESSSLAFSCPPAGDVHISDLGDLLVVASDVIAIDHPSGIPGQFINFKGYKYTYLFAMHSVVDWFAFAIWEHGVLIRSLSLSPDSGIMEDIGPKLSFEEEYWLGKHPAVDPGDEEESYPLPFHPLDFGEGALLQLMGYQLEGFESLNKVDPETIKMHCFRKKRWWKFW